MSLGLRRAAGALLLAVFAAASSGCDNYRDADVLNGCDVPIDVANAARTEGAAVSSLDTGEADTLYSSSGPFDVVVRRTGDAEWSVRILWDQMQERDDPTLREVEVSGDFCP